MKALDKDSLPLTPDEHYKFHHVDKRTSATEFKWFMDLGINCLDLTAALWSAWPDEEKMRRVLEAHRGKR